MRYLKITYKNLSLIFLLAFTLRGISQLLFSIKIINNTTILHILSSGLLFFFFALFLNNVRKNSSIYREHLLLISAICFFITTSIFNNYFNFTDFINYVLPIVIFISLFELRHFIHFTLLVKIVSIVFIFQVFFLLFTKGFGGLIDRDGREGLGSLFGHANSLALMAASVFIVKLDSNVYKNLKNKKLVINILFFTAIAIIGARSMLLSIAFGYLIWLYFKGKISLTNKIITFIMYIFLIFGIVLYGLSLLESSWDVQSYLSGNSLKWRIIHWMYYLRDLDSVQSIVFGFGVGAHENVTDGIYYKYLEVHNDFLRVVYDVGLVGLLIYLSFDYVLTKKIKKHIKLDWRYYLLLSTKYFFMFFDNFVTNMLSITGITLILMFYIKNLETNSGK